MKKIIILSLLLAGAAQQANADRYVNGYMRNNGTYVQPHYQTNSDNNRYNNYSAQGNTNPYTGQQGYVNPNNYVAPAPYQPTYNGYEYQRR